MRRFFRENSLSIVLFSLFFVFLAGQAITGWSEYNSEQREHSSQTVSFGGYLTTGHFGEALFENWESEFLQMSSYILATIWFRQRGSAESKSLSGNDDVDREPDAKRRNAPKSVRVGGWRLKLYENSLSLTFVMLFLVSLLLHGIEGTRTYNEEQRQHQEATVSVAGYMKGSRFWFESFQNWQSEFLATGCIVLFTVWLRQKGSPESKPVDMGHAEMESQ
jgi:succinate dehydrogenase hydrophobic anchor subunit